MAKLTNELNKGLRGRLGNLVYYELNGSTCVRSLPKKYKDRKSDKQIVHRERNYVSEVKRKELSATVNLPFGGGEIITYTIAHRRTP
jgi:hypothetical protein